ncbi:MAG: hypothetical protein HQL63_02575 [Magnetococcales bacterium]|nr:hypothetical protein [Magnetococcales bacterium]MBF0321649.1 hypothetical protein [Magnetococcales bacterium]
MKSRYPGYGASGMEPEQTVDDQTKTMVEGALGRIANETTDYHRYLAAEVASRRLRQQTGWRVSPELLVAHAFGEQQHIDQLQEDLYAAEQNGEWRRYDRLQDRRRDDSVINQNLGGTTREVFGADPDFVRSDQQSGGDAAEGNGEKPMVMAWGWLPRVIGAAAAGAAWYLRKTPNHAIEGEALKAGKGLYEELEDVKKNQDDDDSLFLGMLKGRHPGDKDVQKGAAAQQELVDCHKKNHGSDVEECLRTSKIWNGN